MEHLPSMRNSSFHLFSIAVEICTFLVLQLQQFLGNTTSTFIIYLLVLYTQLSCTTILCSIARRIQSFDWSANALLPPIATSVEFGRMLTDATVFLLFAVCIVLA